MSDPKNFEDKKINLGRLLAWRAECIAKEDGPFFCGLPDRWFESPGPKFRCPNNHVSTMYLKSEMEGDLCLGCYQPVLLTFPEDDEEEI